MYRVVAIGKYGVKDVVAVFPTRERAERYVAKVREYDPEAVLEVEEVREYPLIIVGIVAGIALTFLIIKLLRS